MLLRKKIPLNNVQERDNALLYYLKHLQAVTGQTEISHLEI